MSFCVCRAALERERERERESAGKIHHQAVATNSDAEYVQDMNTFSACSSLLYSIINAACTVEGILCTVSPIYLPVQLLEKLVN